MNKEKKILNVSDKKIKKYKDLKKRLTLMNKKLKYIELSAKFPKIKKY